MSISTTNSSATLHITTYSQFKQILSDPLSVVANAKAITELMKKFNPSQDPELTTDVPMEIAHFPCMDKIIIPTAEIFAKTLKQPPIEMSSEDAMKQFKTVRDIFVQELDELQTAFEGYDPRAFTYKKLVKKIVAFEDYQVSPKLAAFAETWKAFFSDKVLEPKES